MFGDGGWTALPAVCVCGGRGRRAIVLYTAALSVQKCRLLSSLSGPCGTRGGCAHPSGIVWNCWLVKEARHGSKQRDNTHAHARTHTHTITYTLQDKNMHYVNKPLGAFLWISLCECVPACVNLHFGMKPTTGYHLCKQWVLVLLINLGLQSVKHGD